MALRVVRGKDVLSLDGAELGRLRSGYERVVVDVGAGDGRFSYAYARAHPEVLVIGLDIVKENLAEISRRAARRPERGGLPNALYVWASAEDAPRELDGAASEVHVVLPWGKLLEGLVLGDADVIQGLVRLAAPGAPVRITLNCEVWDEAVPLQVRHLPELTLTYVHETLQRRYAALGLRLVEARMLTPEEVARLPSTWAKRLRHGRDWPRFLYLEAVTPASP